MEITLKHIVPTEKANLMIDSENKVQFIVDLRASKREIKSEVHPGEKRKEYRGGGGSGCKLLKKV